MNVSKINSYVELAKNQTVRAIQKQSEAIVLSESALETKKLFEKSLERAQEIADAKKDPQHLINLLV